MKPRFEPDIDSDVRLPSGARLIDPEAYDASEQHFAASVEENPAPRQFVVDGTPESSSDAHPADDSFQVEGPKIATVHSDPKGPVEPVAQGNSLQNEPLRPPDSDAWRHEVADRVNNYRARRRPRAPRYPSLQLKFDPPEPSWTANPATIEPATTAAPSRLAVARQDALSAPREEQSIQAENDRADYLDVAEPGARILEFPRSAAPPPVFDGLAEPIVDSPRILEVPELLLPPPALGGILMEAVEEPAKERRPGFELPLQAAPMSRRFSAGAVDAMLVILAVAMFAYIFFRVTSITPPLPQAAVISLILAAVFWTAYQWLLLIYTGTTPGLKIAKLQLSRFDGTAVPRKTRRWRVLASMLSGVSLALGYAWCFLDEDRLCWHDRITQTYMAPKSYPAVPPCAVGTGRSSSRA
ncbi:MAG TPA: RDD family protein [Terriglobales bacterium]|jgi:uncharacterized RDD family membrane protein YckC|nr:RDD family protein [Terriglobales bacterium]